MNVSELTEKLELNAITRFKWHIQATSAVKGYGLYDGLEWLSNQIHNSS